MFYSFIFIGQSILHALLTSQENTSRISKSNNRDLQLLNVSWLTINLTKGCSRRKLAISLFRIINERLGNMLAAHVTAAKWHSVNEIFFKLRTTNQVYVSCPHGTTSPLTNRTRSSHRKTTTFSTMFIVLALRPRTPATLIENNNENNR
jgi:hypothetical protein